MSAYGAIARAASGPLPSTTWLVRSKDPSANPSVTLHHLTLQTARQQPGLVEYLHKVFADELESGLTYPQEVGAASEYTEDQFAAYYFAADVIVAVASTSGSKDGADGEVSALGFTAVVSGRSWEECIAGCYYVKPNYPGRSSHICNAGFLVPPLQRGRGFGGALARSYLHYAPRLGYEASVFNLVYVNNVASVRLWEALGFEKAGRIPRAGRLKKADGSGEEFVDAWVFYKKFDS